MNKLNWYFSLLLVLGGIASNAFGQSLSQRKAKAQRDFLRVQLANVDDITPFVHTTKQNYGDSILELFAPPIESQGSQGSCLAWAFGYGCGSIQAY